MNNFFNIILYSISIPFLILILFVVGYLIRAILIKESDITNNFGSIMKSVIIGLITIIILGTALKSCNQGDENEEIWKRD